MEHSQDKSNEAQPGQLRQAGVSRRRFFGLWPEYTRWKVVEVYRFDASWYVVQGRQNKATGYKSFRCNKIIPWHHGRDTANMTPECLEALFGGG
jgi:hypothetical protein